MKFICIESEHTLADKAAGEIIGIVNAKPDAFIMLASGQSPTLAYDCVSKKLNGDTARFASVKVHKLDEWEGLGLSDPQSCDSYLMKHVLQPWGIKTANYSGINALSSNLQQECDKANALLNDIINPDLCILGIGLNGHIGFNEPADALPAQTAVVKLADSSMKHPMIEGTAPITRGITTGIAQILMSKKIIVIVTGKNKQAVLKRLMETTQVSTQFPASLLLTHPDVTVMYDAQAK
ncbi:6-phosphogluconolactonase [Atlantibacter subterranea]|uniref:6-phosphogluconolactonase n=1 Tax=Atlantibacter subterraneus TaxID=255519 RepID=A0ABU4E2V1_9ENTR|nr:6-phosphogluconolactonase [Atlantibacter subterranea]MDV7023439.1 6-phosphogluconolactonase [Atlantibacter subterranea]MDZ5666267.1 6-phosphogluconolactonase [Atlantibacter hermannii]QFH68402.1 hypothetical protein FR762_00880 [Enterobacter sp. E76]UTJ48279.1 6-phosphogluconolactonase [Atlantibacter subterranea]